MNILKAGMLKNKFKKLFIDKICKSRLFCGYIICAGAAAIVDITLLFVLIEFLEISYLFSNVISYSLGMIVNFSLNKTLNFRNKSKEVFSQFSIFVGIALLGLVVNELVLFTLVDGFNINYVLAKVFALIVAGLFNYFGHKTYTFKKNKTYEV